MKIDFTYPDGATPLTNDELFDLVPPYVTTQGELNAVEQLSIAKGLTWLSAKHFTTEDILTEPFTKMVHKRLFKDVWKWAGQFRKTDKNIGVHWLKIAIQLKKLFDDTHYHIQYNSYAVDEIVVRFHHRLVQIHPFPNGNGRHARILADLLLQTMEQTPFTWGGYDIKSHSQQTTIRQQYIQGLREADKGNISLLLEFIRGAK